MQLSAPAKINLSFRIVGKRPDGFHQIESLMSPISLADRLSFRLLENSTAVEFICDDASLPAGPGNLVVRAAQAFLAASGRQVGVSIELEKRIPHGAGLGGGSSDAATALLGLNQLLDAKFSNEQLMQIGAEIGSDVPFFIVQSAANCRGRGEEVATTILPRALRLLLVKPQFGVPTPAAYSRWSASRELPDLDYGPQEFGGITFCNDLERPVFEKYVFLAEIKSWLRQQPEVAVALLSGSGSTVFAVLRDGLEDTGLATRIQAELDPSLWTCAATTTAPV